MSKIVEKTTKKKHIEKANEKTQKRLKELDDEMRSLAFTGSDGKDYLPRMAIVENKLTDNQKKLVKKMMNKFSCTEKEATTLIKS